MRAKDQLVCHTAVHLSHAENLPWRCSHPTVLEVCEYTYSPGYAGQDLLDPDHQSLVLLGIALNSTVQLGHIEIQRAQCGSFTCACQEKTRYLPVCLIHHLSNDNYIFAYSSNS